ncbi:MAG: histidine phosphatase family protein [Oscillospiraceae bacterium]|nr:histidine phosphatase family protein [Oscillospiraceae bacterium]
MEVILLRHAETAGNLEKRYIGITDEPLCEEGKRHAIRSGILPGFPLVYSSPSIRAVQTATIKFPGARMILFPGLREMNFGIFEGKNAAEMENDLRYRAWVDGDCFGECPRGEGRIGFSARCCIAFAEIIGENLSRKRRIAVIVAHGGTIMAIMERFAHPHKKYFGWAVPPCGGYIMRLDDESWAHSPALTDIERMAI